MKSRTLIFAFVLSLSVTVFSQREEEKRPRVVVVEPSFVKAQPSPTPAKEPLVSLIQGSDKDYSSSNAQLGSTDDLSLAKIKNKIMEARILLQSKPLLISFNDSSQVDTNWVRLAFFDRKKEKVDFVTLPKPLFLRRGAQIPAYTSDNRAVTVSIIRGNGVNTPVTIWEDGIFHLPLLVQYPIERDRRHKETAYYVSTHPGLVKPEVVQAGKVYVRSIIDAARGVLREKGVFIQKEIADIAERLMVVEHVDHYRFRNELHINIFNDIYAIYALNEGQAYWYAVSRAGAGGAVQMIPSTYAMVRTRFYHVGLIPDFVEGMRNHLNAVKAMLLYMKMTWDELIMNETVFQALQSGIATQGELLAAGYNSNPARLPTYIRRGGENWRSLIPAETRIYLEIYRSMELFVPIEPRKE